jgi:phosphoglucomutase
MTSKLDARAGQPATTGMLIDVARLISAYFSCKPDPSVAAQRVQFGTSGHRGSAFSASFNEAHILAITQAICRYRQKEETTGPLFIGRDTHALSEPALATALEVLAANGVTAMVDAANGYTPTPVISHAILAYNHGRSGGVADGIVITPSHNPPDEGGFKYNPPHGGPAGTEATGWIEGAANRSLERKLTDIVRMSKATTPPKRYDFVSAYVSDLDSVVDMEAIRASGVRIGIDPLGGAAVHFWGPIIERYKIAASVVNDVVDPTFRFMTLDWDGKIRMDCSSPYAMARLIAMKDKFDIAFANDTDADRHGIVCKSSGLMEPNSYLSAAISHLFGHRADWAAHAAIGKTVVSSAMIERVTADMGRKLIDVPVGFKWFVDGLGDGSLAFAGEESAGAAFTRRDGTVWTTDKDGLILGLLAAEITARDGRSPDVLFDSLAGRLGRTFYQRTDAPATVAQKAALAKLAPGQVEVETLANDPITRKLNTAPGNGEPIGGIKIVTNSGWFAARGSGTEDVYKIYAESFVSAEHLNRIEREAQEILTAIAAF